MSLVENRSFISLWKSSLFLCCPACGKGKLYQQWLQLNDFCSHCSFPLAIYRLSIFRSVCSAIAAVLFFVAIYTLFALPLWFYIPVALLGALYVTKLLNALAVAAHYKHHADQFGHSHD